MCAVLGKTCTKADVLLANPRQVCEVAVQLSNHMSAM